MELKQKEVIPQIQENQITIEEGNKNKISLENSEGNSLQNKKNEEEENEKKFPIQEKNKNFFELFIERIKMLADESDQQLAPKLSYLKLFQRFLWFGLRAFGGPVAQIQMMKQELVIDEKWVDSDRFLRVFAIYQALPGPEVNLLIFLLFLF